MTNTLKLQRQRHTDGATTEPVCRRLCVCLCVNACVCLFPVLNETTSQELHTHTNTHTPFLVCRRTPGDNLDSRSKHKSPSGPLASFLFGPWTAYPFSCWVLGAVKAVKTQ